MSYNDFELSKSTRIEELRYYKYRCPLFTNMTTPFGSLLVTSSFLGGTAYFYRKMSHLAGPNRIAAGSLLGGLIATFTQSVVKTNLEGERSDESFSRGVYGEQMPDSSCVYREDLNNVLKRQERAREWFISLFYKK